MDKQLSVLLIGCGRVSIKHIKAINSLSSNIILCGLVDTNQTAAQAMLKNYKGSNEVKIYSDYKLAITELKPTIVAVTVPSGLHFEIAQFSLENDCNLLLEKPMTMSSEQCKQIYELSVKTGKKIAMGHIYRYFPLVGLLREDLSNGSFGKVLYGTISVRWGHGQDYYDSSAWRGTWKSDGGALMNQSVHAIDLLIWLMSDKAISTTSMLAQRMRKIEAEDLGLAVIKLQSGALASIEGTTSTLEKDKQASFNIYCEKGHVSLGLKRGMPWIDITNEKNKKLNFKYVCKQIKRFGFKSLLRAGNPHTAIYDNLISSITDNKQPIADAMSGYSSVDTLLGIYKSAKEQREISLPLEENFSSVDMQGFFEKV